MKMHRHNQSFLFGSLSAVLLLAIACTNETENSNREGDTGGTGGTGGTSDTGGTGGVANNSGEGTRCDRNIGAGADGCADNFYASGMGFDVTPTHLTTDHDPEGTLVIRGKSSYTIPDQVLDTLQNHTSIERPDEGFVPQFLSVWESEISEEHHEAKNLLTPASALSEGWYAVRITGSLDTGRGTPINIPTDGSYVYVSYFRVGSAPVLVEAHECSDTVSLKFSEEVLVPEPIPITIEGAEGSLSCTRHVEPGGPTSPASNMSLKCTGSTEGSINIEVGEGFESSSGVPLRNAAGEASFKITLPPSTGTCKSWKEILVPTF